MNEIVQTNEVNVQPLQTWEAPELKVGAVTQETLNNPGGAVTDGFTLS